MEQFFLLFMINLGAFMLAFQTCCQDYIDFIKGVNERYGK